MRLDLDDLRSVFGLGVAGNVAGHLEQAGEAGDFVSVAAAAEAPKGIFPFYAPGTGSFLAGFPLSHDRIATPPSDAPLNLQIEPEVGLLAAVTYDADGRVTQLAPQAIAAFNDCSIRRPGAKKISEKKHWGPDSKGVAAQAFAIADLDADTRALRLASFLRRDGETHAYGVDSALGDYSYFGDELLDWLVDRLAGQRGGDDTPLEDVGALLAASGSPDRVLVGIGATRYTDVGATTFLTDGDESIVVLYDAEATAPEAIEDAVRAGREAELPAASVLVQRVSATIAAPNVDQQGP